MFTFNSTVREYCQSFFGKEFRVVKSTDLVGIEVEVEGSMKFNTRTSSTIWEVKGDSSLRNGYELVLNQPVGPERITEVVEDLKRILKFSKLVPSIRTSTHVHVCVLDYSMRALFSVLLYYWMFENILVKMQGPDREGNLHCLRLSDAINLYESVVDGLNSGRYFGNLIRNEWRYAALNVASVPKFGTVEYRFMSLPDDLQDVAFWTKTLHSFTRRAGETPWVHIYDWVKRGPREALRHFFGPELTSRAIDKLGEDYCISAMYQNLDLLTILLSKLQAQDQSVSAKYPSERDADLELNEGAERKPKRGFSVSLYEEGGLAFSFLNDLQENMTQLYHTSSTAPSDIDWSPPQGMAQDDD